MRMPLSEFLTNGDLKFVITLFIFLLIAIVYFLKKTKHPKKQEIYNDKIRKLVSWSLLMSVFSLLLGLLHSFYFISKSSGISNNLLFSGLSTMLITPTLGIVICLVIKLLATPINLQNN